MHFFLYTRYDDAEIAQYSSLVLESSIFSSYKTVIIHLNFLLHLKDLFQDTVFLCRHNLSFVIADITCRTRGVQEIVIIIVFSVIIIIIISLSFNFN